MCNVVEEGIMKIKFIFIHFVKIADKPKTSVWSCRNNKSDSELGRVRWYPAWRQYIYEPACEAVYSVGCLEDINDFIKQLSNR